MSKEIKNTTFITNEEDFKLVFKEQVKENDYLVLDAKMVKKMLGNFLDFKHNNTINSDAKKQTINDIINLLKTPKLGLFDTNLTSNNSYENCSHNHPNLEVLLKAFELEKEQIINTGIERGIGNFKREHEKNLFKLQQEYNQYKTMSEARLKQREAELEQANNLASLEFEKKLKKEKESLNDKFWIKKKNQDK
ncbi:hypothetical protein [Mycoplasmopsis agassizii]|uniref:Uncharacterized protein n=1 Tax=Mycoplasmopsis agassizii TaxID=33922 RepID=A0ABX4H662_9BACT|nr:hypothetical protein [Mycoplasmopsis agassizii]PAF55380.1 hypothetical protein CJF60_01670 [Mycoplasmopsis agassizii]SMC18199.1 hypothetical protein SAMN02745179_00617 [Mycoplasmopsis agassizii]